MKKKGKKSSKNKAIPKNKSKPSKIAMKKDPKETNRSKAKTEGKSEDGKITTDLKLPNFEDPKNHSGEQPKEYVERLLKENFEELSKSENFDASEIDTQHVSLSADVEKKPKMDFNKFYSHKIPKFHLTKKVKVGILVGVAIILVIMIIVFV